MLSINGRVSGGGRGEENERLTLSLTRRNDSRGGEETGPARPRAWRRGKAAAQPEVEEGPLRVGSTRKRERG
jgi:hypothetical protein